MLLRYRPIDTWPGPLTGPREPTKFSATWTDTLKLLDRELEQVRADAPVLQLAIAESDLRLGGDIKANASPRHPGVILTFTHPTQGPISYPCDRFDGATNWIGMAERRNRDVRAAERGGSSRHTRTVPGWQANVRAVALGLGHLRTLTRYGIVRNGQQYAGWKQIGGVFKGNVEGVSKATADAHGNVQGWATVQKNFNQQLAEAKGTVEALGIRLGTGTPMPAAMTIEAAARFIGEWSEADDAAIRAMPSSADIATEAYRRAAKRLHPDAGGDPALFRRLNDAHQLLERTQP